MKGLSLDSLKEIFAEDLATLTAEEKAEAVAIAADTTNLEESREQRLANLLEKARKEVEASGYDPYAHKATKGLAKQVLNKIFKDYQLSLKIDYDNCRNLLNIDICDQDLIDPNYIAQKFTLLGNSDEEFKALIKELRGPTPEERAELLALEKKAVEEAAKIFTDYISDKDLLKLDKYQAIKDLAFQVFKKEGEAIGATPEKLAEWQEKFKHLYLHGDNFAKNIKEEIIRLSWDLNVSLTDEEKNKIYNNSNTHASYYYKKFKEIEEVQKADLKKNQKYLEETVCVPLIKQLKKYFGDRLPEVLNLYRQFEGDKITEEIASVVKEINSNYTISEDSDIGDNLNININIPYNGKIYSYNIIRIVNGGSDYYNIKEGEVIFNPENPWD